MILIQPYIQHSYHKRHHTYLLPITYLRLYLSTIPLFPTKSGRGHNRTQEFHLSGLFQVLMARLTQILGGESRSIHEGRTGGGATLTANEQRKKGGVIVLSSSLLTSDVRHNFIKPQPNRKLPQQEKTNENLSYILLCSQAQSSFYLCLSP